jgi:hypothetical protein
MNDQIDVIEKLANVLYVLINIIIIIFIWINFDILIGLSRK